MSIDPISAVEPTRVTVVESEACHFCRDAHRDLEELATCYPLTVDTLSVRSAAGQDLVARHCAASSPLVLLARVPGALVHGGRGEVPPLATAALTFVFVAGLALVLVPITLGTSLVASAIANHHQPLYYAGGVLMLALAVFSLSGRMVSLPSKPRSSPRRTSRYCRS